MKILHTGDWHLGKLFHAINLLDDQRHVLEQVVAIVQEEKPDVVVVAGDVYDRAVPPAGAVALLDWVLTELVLRLGTPTVLIAGNHDSPDRLQFGARLLEQNGLFVVGTLQLAPLPFSRGTETTYVCPAPFADPATVREYLNDDSITSHETAMRAITGRFRSLVPTGAPAVLVAHAYVAGASPSDSERPLSIGGADQVAASCFDGFAYAALGHLHTPQVAADPRVRYSGSLLKYSRSEVATSKSVTITEVGSDRSVSIRELPLAPKHDVREIQGTLADIEAGNVSTGNADDYLYVKLLDAALPVNAMSRLRARFPNVVDADVSAAVAAAGGPAAGQQLRQLDDITLFDTFMTRVTGAGLTVEDRKLIAAAIAAASGEVSQ